MANNSGMAAQSRSQSARQGAKSRWERFETEPLAAVVAPGFYTFNDLANDGTTKVGDFIDVIHDNYCATLRIIGYSAVGVVFDSNRRADVPTAWDTVQVCAGGAGAGIIDAVITGGVFNPLTGAIDFVSSDPTSGGFSVPVLPLLDNTDLSIDPGTYTYTDADETVDLPLVDAGGAQVGTVTLDLTDVASDDDLAAAIAALNATIAALAPEDFLVSHALAGTVLNSTLDGGAVVSVDLAALDENIVDNGDGTFTGEDAAGNPVTWSTDTDDQVIASADGSVIITPTILPNGQVNYDLSAPVATISRPRRVSPNVSFDALDPNFTVNGWNYGGVATMPLPSHPTKDVLYVIDVETLWYAGGLNLVDGGVKATFRLEVDKATGSFTTALPAWALSLQANELTPDLAHGETAQYSRRYYHLVPAGSATVNYRAHSAVSLTASTLNVVLNHQSSSPNNSALSFNPRTFIEAVGHTTE